MALKFQERKNYRYFPTKSEDIKLEMKTKIRNKSAQNNLKMQGRVSFLLHEIKNKSAQKNKRIAAAHNFRVVRDQTIMKNF